MDCPQNATKLGCYGGEWSVMYTSMSLSTERDHAHAPDTSGKNTHVELKYGTDDRTQPHTGGSEGTRSGHMTLSFEWRKECLAKLTVPFKNLQEVCSFLQGEIHPKRTLIIMCGNNCRKTWHCVYLQAGISGDCEMGSMLCSSRLLPPGPCAPTGPLTTQDLTFCSPQWNVPVLRQVR